MRLDFAEQRVMAVVAHPDDAELLCAGTLARARADGAAVAICTLCRGEKGGAGADPDTLAQQRKREVIQAARILEAETYFLGIADGQLADTAADRRNLLVIYRDFRPTLVLAHAPEDYHPDHRAAGAIAEAATWFAASAGHDTDQEPLARPPALWWMDTVNMLGFQPGFFVDVSKYLAVKQKMLQCHQTQLRRGGDADFEPLEQLLLRQASARGAQAGVEAAEAFRMHMAWKRTRAW